MGGSFELELILGKGILQIISSKPLATENGSDSTGFAVPAQGGLSPGKPLGRVTADALCFDNILLRPLTSIIILFFLLNKLTINLSKIM